MSGDKTLDELRLQVRCLDEQLLQLVAKRQELARSIGRIKSATQLPIKDYRVEKEVLERSRAQARALGLYESMAEELSRLLIRYSVQAQDEGLQRHSRRAHGPAQRVLILGGRGRMGLWLSEFFDAFGHQVSHLGPAGDDPLPAHLPAFPLLTDLREAALNHDIIVLATPISVTPGLIAALAASDTKALVFDICSLKTPIIPALRAAAARGLRIGSVHPMFGPQVDVLAGRHILICDVGQAEVTAATRAIFQPTPATLTAVPLGRHDQLMSYVLGLSHLVNLVFTEVLRASGESFAELGQAASTTFSAQLAVALPVAQENPALYYEIQAENRFTPQLVAALEAALGTYAAAISSKDKTKFCALMAASRTYCTQAHSS